MAYVTLDVIILVFNHVRLGPETSALV
jgi:hypothetical protein